MAGLDALEDALPEVLLPAGELPAADDDPPVKQLESPELNEQDEQIKRMTMHTTSLNRENGRL